MFFYACYDSSRPNLTPRFYQKAWGMKFSGESVAWSLGCDEFKASKRKRFRTNICTSTLYNNKISFYLLCMWKRSKWYDRYCTFRSLLYTGWNVGVAYKSDRKILNKQTGKRSAHVKYLQKLHTASKNTVVIKHIFFVFYLAAGGPIKITQET